MKRYFATIIIAAVALYSAHCQEKSVIVNAEGRCELSRFITLEQAEEKALMEAKHNALSKAGVDENVWSVFGLLSENSEQQFEQVYSEMSILAVGGLVHLLEEPVYTQEYSEFDKRDYVVCRIKAEVKNGERADKSFQIQVKGVAPVYREEEILNIEIISSQDAYVRIFWFNKEEGEQILPNQIQQEHFISKDTKFSFPDSDLYELVMEKKDKTAATEHNTFMVIATKKDYPFFEDEVSFKTLLNWIYNIPAYDRCAYYETFYIK